MHNQLCKGGPALHLVALFSWSATSGRLKSLPLALYLISMVVASSSANVSDSIEENIMLKFMEANMQPCVTPLVTGKTSECSASSRNRARIPS